MITEVPVIVRDLDRTKVEYLGRYKVVKMIGQGTFGTVYKCLTYKGYEYAIKQIHNIRMKKMMKNELDALMSVCSKYVVRYYELFYDKNDQPCIVLELCDGGSLADFARKFPNHSIPEKLALQIFTKVLLGFTAIQKANLIHRDVKLQNIMMKGGDTPKIGDFGLATQQKMQEIKTGLFASSNSNSSNSNAPSGQQTTGTAANTQQPNTAQHNNISNNTYTVAGTPAYMAPEVLQGTEQNQQVDIWSLGVMLLAMLFGDFPFYDSTIHGQLERIRKICDPQFNYERIRKSRHQIISEDTLQLLQRMIVIDPAKRATLQELLQLPVIISHMDKEDLVEQMKEQGQIVGVDLDKAEKKEGAEAKRSLLRTLNSIQVDGSPTVMKLKLFDFTESLHKSKLQGMNKGEMTISQVNGEDGEEGSSEEEDGDANEGQDGKKTINPVKVTMTTNTIRPLVAEEALVPYNQMLNRITLLVDTYELFAESNEYIQSEFKDPEIALILYFLSRVILMQFQGLNKILDERDNLFNIDNWSSFIFSKSYLGIQASVQSDMQIWMEKADVLFVHLKEIQLIELEANIGSSSNTGENVQSMTQQIDSLVLDAEEQEEKERRERREKQRKEELARKQAEREKEKERIEQLNREKQAEKERLADRSGGVEKGTIASENKRKQIINAKQQLQEQQEQLKAASTTTTTNNLSQMQGSSSSASQQQQPPPPPKLTLTLLKDIIDAIQPPLEGTIPQDYSFKSAKLPDDLKVAFRAVLLTAYTRLNNNDFLLESPPDQSPVLSSPPMKQQINKNAEFKQRMSMNNLPSLNFISNTSSTTISVVQSTKNHNNNSIGNSLVASLKSPASNTASMSCLKSTSHITTTNNNTAGNNKLQVTQSKPTNGNHTSTSIKNNASSSCSITNSTTGIPLQNINTSIKEINLTPNLNVLPSSPTKQQSSQQQILKRGSVQAQFSSSSHLTIPNKLTTTSISKSPTMSSTSQKQITKMNPIVAPHLISGNNKSQNNDQQYSRAQARVNEFFTKQKSEKQRIQEMKELERKRYGFRVLLSTVTNHFLLLADQNIPLEDFQKYLLNAHADKTPSSRKLKNEDILKSLLLWLREISIESIKTNTDIVFGEFLPQIKQFNMSFF